MKYFKKNLTIVCTLSLILISHTLKANWTSFNPLPSDAIRFITYDSGNHTYYAAASFPEPGVYSKTTTDTAWTLVGPTSGSGSLLAAIQATVVPTGVEAAEIRSLLRQNNTLYVGSASALFKKSDTDDGWTQIGNPILNPTSLLVNSHFLFVAGAGGVSKLDLSVSGASFTHVGPASGAGSLTTANTLVTDGTHLFAGTTSGTVYSASIADPAPTWSLVAPTSGTTGFLPTPSNVRALATRNGFLLAATTSGAFYTQTTSPYVWTRLGPSTGAGSLASATSFAIPPFTGTPVNKIYTSNGDGLVFLITTTNPLATGYSTLGTATITSVGTIPKYAYQVIFDGNKLFTSTYSGVWNADPSSPTWTLDAAGLPQVGAYSLLHISSNVITGTSVGVYQSSGTSAWHLVGPASGETAALDYPVALAHANSKIYVGSDGTVFSRGDTDALESDWIVENPTTTTGHFSNVATSLTNSSTTLFASTYNGVYARTGDGPWIDVSAPGSTSSLFRHTNRALYANSRLYAATEDGVWSKTDSESTLTLLGPSSGPGSLTSIVNDLAYSENTIFVCTDVGIYSKANSADAWMSITPPLPNSKVILRDGETLYVGTSDSGVYSKKDSETSWTRIGPDSGDGSFTGSVYSLLLDNNTLYLGSKNKGVFSYALPSVTGTGGDSGTGGASGSSGAGGEPVTPSASDASSGGCSLIH